VLVDADRQVLAVMVRADLIEETMATALPRAVEYTIWSETQHGFGLCIRPSGAPSFLETCLVQFPLSGFKVNG
jgi:hypothetical protein